MGWWIYPTYMLATWAVDYLIGRQLVMQEEHWEGIERVRTRTKRRMEELHREEVQRLVTALGHVEEESQLENRVVLQALANDVETYLEVASSRLSKPERTALEDTLHQIRSALRRHGSSD